ncbi:MAG: hypothetical protein QNL01_07260 [Akkermansiaceae bacterium]|jgi:hypothetical protein|tara:strand:+ start:672 stop:959 length:288 start_codon:yes stop_codon:yes gene_type:complete
MLERLAVSIYAAWLMLGLNQLGPIINVDEAKSPYSNSRRLITSADVGNNAGRAPGASTPGGNSPKGKDGKLLYTHPVNEVGKSVQPEERCRKHLK